MKRKTRSQDTETITVTYNGEGRLLGRFGHVESGHLLTLKVSEWAYLQKTGGDALYTVVGSQPVDETTEGAKPSGVPVSALGEVPWESVTGEELETLSRDKLLEYADEVNRLNSEPIPPRASKKVLVTFLLEQAAELGWRAK